MVDGFRRHRYVPCMQHMQLEAAAACLEALGNATRLAAYRLLVRAGPEGLPVGSVQEALGVPPSTLSHHLRRLVSVGLVTQERRGATLICRASYAVMGRLVDYLTAECCAGARREDDAA
jgi:ArsR family transcriptional regulator, arsenate/arsenite/antimonite-responsive transcriptional repressor